MRTIDEEIREELDKFKIYVADLITGMFAEHHAISPTVFMLMYKDREWGAGVVGGLESLFVNDTGKDIAAMVMRKISKEAKPLATAFVTEAWVVKTTIDKRREVLDDQGEMKVRPMDHPDRIEAVIIIVETHNKHCMISWEIVREDGKAPWLKSMDLGEWMDKSDNKLEGRFTGLLEENYSDIVQELKKKLKLEVN